MEDFYVAYGKVILAPLIAIGLDVITGFIAAAKNGEVDSSVMRGGLWSKLSEIATIVLSLFLEFAANVYGEYMHFTIDVPIRYAVCAYITMYEVVSILENIGKLNPDIAYWFIRLIGIKPEKMNMILAEEVDENASDELESDSTVC